MHGPQYPCVKMQSVEGRLDATTTCQTGALPRRADEMPKQVLCPAVCHLGGGTEGLSQGTLCVGAGPGGQLHQRPSVAEVC